MQSSFFCPFRAAEDFRVAVGFLFGHVVVFLAVVFVVAAMAMLLLLLLLYVPGGLWPTLRRARESTTDIH